MIHLMMVVGYSGCKLYMYNVNFNDFLSQLTQNHMNSCPFLKIPCVYPECGMQVNRADLTEHFEKECKCRLETCGFCKRQINPNRMKVG